jgi:ABC-type Fe3+/spermidine/putrescine transport system ATPase subunit
LSLLALKSVSKSYGGRAALLDFSLDIADGERVALLGPSGCGKTTALRLLAGLETPDRGQVVIGGRLAAAEGRLVMEPEDRNLGMVFQDLALWPHMTVAGNLEFGLRARGVPKEKRREKIRAMLDKVELLAYAQRRPSSLSGGQQQRVALARALVLGPKALLMDEPLSSLDVALNLKLREEILALHGALGFALLYVTHDAEEAGAIAERVLTMGERPG